MMKCEEWVVDKCAKKFDGDNYWFYDKVVEIVCPSSIGLKEKECSPSDYTKGGCCKGCWLKARVLKLIDKSHLDCLMTFKEFYEAIDCGGINHLDGFGRYSDGEHDLGISVDILGGLDDSYSHVLWYNK